MKELMRVRAHGLPSELFDVGTSPQCFEACFGSQLCLATPWQRDSTGLFAGVPRWSSTVVVTRPQGFLARRVLRLKPNTIIITQSARYQEHQIVLKNTIRARGFEVEMEIEFRHNEVRVWWIVDHAPKCGWCKLHKCTDEVERTVARFLEYMEKTAHGPFAG